MIYRFILLDIIEFVKSNLIFIENIKNNFMSNTKDNVHFTIIIPTKDRAQYLEQTLKTCTNQDYENLEIIVSDDGSVR